ncbi:MAG: glycine betaine ABC transporter substrate-binding protein [Gammaproteobacteria bacterium]
MRRLVLVILLAVISAGCGRVSEGIRIGSKDFTEQKILAEMMALAAESERIPVERVIPSGDSRTNLYAIQSGVIDAYPDYTGTVLALSGVAPYDDPGRSRKAVQDLVAPLGLRWVVPLGFSNDFAVVVRRDFALRNNLANISDLSELPGSLRIASDTDFASRPVDGLTGLVRRYGLTLSEVLETRPRERGVTFEALLERRVDAAVVFMTDPAIASYGVTVLEDDLGFFPSYEAGVLMRAPTLEEVPKLRRAFQKLSGLISAGEMQQLIAQVDYLGEDPRTVAQRYLVSKGVLDGDTVVQPATSSVSLAIGPVADRGTLTIDATRAIRKVMPGRRLTVEAAPLPDEAVRSGRARFALLGSESFFTPPPNPPVPVEGIEAVGAVGTHMAHLIARRGSRQPSLVEKSRIAVGAPGGASDLVTRHLLDALDLEETIELVAEPDPDARVALVDGGDVDGAMFMAEPGHPWIANLLATGNRELKPITALRESNHTLRYPFLRPARIPASAYPGLELPVATVASQVVLAAVATKPGGVIGETGPQIVPGLGTDTPEPVPPEMARRLNAALPFSEAVDPLLPASPGLNPRARDSTPYLRGNPVSAILNVLAVAFLVWMVRLYFKELPHRPALRPGRHEDS